MASKTYEIAFQLGAKIASTFGTTFNTASKSIQNLENQSKTANTGFLNLGEGARKVATAAIGVGAIVGAGLGFKAMFSAAEASQQKMAQMDAVLKSTGSAAGMTKEQLLSLAAAQGKVTTFSKGTNIATENLLLTFTGISSKVFPDVLQATNDMATALGTDTSSAAMTLGKALNDPAAGLTKLIKQGVTFTEEQKNQIKAMTAAGDTAGAQSIILKELQREFGGSAEAAGKTFGGQLTILKNSITGVGGSIASTLMPAATTFMTAINTNLPAIQDIIVSVINTVGPYIAGIMSDISKIATNLLPNLGSSSDDVKNSILSLVNGGFSAFKGVLDWIAQHGDATKTVLETLAIATSAYGIAIAAVTIKQKAALIIESLSKAWWVATGIIGAMRNGMTLAAIAQDALNIAMKANPIGLITIAISVLIGLGVLIYKNWGPISSFFSKIWVDVKASFSNFWNWIKGFLSTWGTVILAITVPFIGIPLLIIQHWDEIKVGLSAIWNVVYTNTSSIISNIYNTVINGFTNAYNGIISIFGNIKSTVSTIFMDIWNIIKQVINTGIGMINGFIGGINTVIDVANKVPGVNIGVVGTIPQLANGGYIKHRPGGIIANIGEGKEDEIVSPVSKLKNIMNSSSTGQQPTITYAPQIIIQGNASKDDVVQALSISKSEFKKLMDDYKSGGGRLSFN